MPEAGQFTSNGWLRQQIIKLHLDQILNLDHWFFTDGDIVFLHTVDPEHTPYSTPEYTEVNYFLDQYIKLFLRITPGIYVNSQQVCVSNPAFRTMERMVLEQLRQHVLSQHGQSLAELHLPYLKSNIMGVSEWELIGNFQHHILGEQLILTKYAPHDIQTALTTPGYNLNHFSHQCLTHYGTDKDLGKECFANYNIDISDNMWDTLSKISK
jgi:hypothetical protein